MTETPKIPTEHDAPVFAAVQNEAEVESEAKVSPRLTIVSPIAGVVSELTAREGMTVTVGAPLFRVNGIATVWVNAEVPEAASSQVHAGDRVEVEISDSRGAVVSRNPIAAVLPEVNPATRTRRIRVELANPSARLAPGMSATIDFAPAARRKALLVPTEAVIRSGERSLVLVAEEDPAGARRFHAVEVEAGVESGSMTEIRKGLAAGQRIVASGQFLLDSEASLKAGAARLAEPPGAKR